MIRRHEPYRDFGINSIVIPWTDDTGGVYEAVLLRPFETMRHTISTVLGNRAHG